MVSIIVGTNRAGSMSSKVARAYSKILTEHDAPNQVLYLEDLPRDFAFTDLYGARTAEMEKIISVHVSQVSYFVFVLPEYNGGFSGVVKTFIDAVEPMHWQGKWAALVGVSSGMAGNLRGLEHFTGIMNYLQVNVLFRKPKLSRIEGLFAEGRLNEATEISLRTQMLELLHKMDTRN